MGRKRLNGSAGTGKKILKNLNLFEYDIKDIDGTLYIFKVRFDGTDGICTIRVNEAREIERINLNMNNFMKSLPEYNDPTLKMVAEIMMKNIK